MDTLYARLVQDLPNGAAFVVDHQLRYLLAGGEALAAAGLSGADLLGKAVADVVPPALAAQALQDYQDALRGQAFSRRHTVGGREYVTHGSPLRGADGRVLAALAVSCDVTGSPASRQSADGLEHGAAQDAALAALNRRKDVFLATLAHELRNVLAPLRSGVEILQMGPLDPGQSARVFGLLDRQVTQMSRLVEDLVDVSRIAEGKLRLAPALLRVQEAVDLALETSRPMLLACGHEVVVTVESPGHRLWADPARLTQILSNLLNNAAKFTPAGGRIELRAAAEGGSIVFQVIDNGPGIAPDQLLKVFEMYEQAGGGPTPSGTAGLGIGLALVRALAELHGGQVHARSEGPGTGSTFTVTLPQGTAPQAGAQR